MFKHIMKHMKKNHTYHFDNKRLERMQDCVFWHFFIEFGSLGDGFKAKLLFAQ